MNFRHFAAAAALAGAAGLAQAAVVTFDDPSVVTIDNSTGVATYAEAGYALSGQAADFLLLDDGAGNGFLVGGFFGAGPLSLTADGGGLFTLLSLDYGYFDLGEPPGTLTVTGFLNGNVVGTEMLMLAGQPASFSFGSSFGLLSEVRFSGSSGFTLDNISAIPEPGSLALVALGLGALVAGRRRTGQVAV